MKKFGLLGRTLKHSYSPQIHKELGAYSYELMELEPDKLEEFVKSDTLDGFNVTIPYKQEIIKYLDQIDEIAKKIGAVNTVVKKGDKLYGYNTDYLGMEYALKSAKINLKNKSVLILGSGGTSLTARVVSECLDAKAIKILSRSGEINYDNYFEKAKDTQIIINTTPVGMYPDNYSCRVDLKVFDKLEGVFDVVYNPSLTKLLCQAKEMGIKYANGLAMLVAQAKFASEKFLSKKLDDGVIEKIVKKLKTDSQNLVLVGMPGSGKTTIGKKLSELLGKEFIDTDELIVEKEQKTIPDIFAEFKEDYFRKVESEVIMEVGKLSNKVISTGGGAIKNRDNYFSLKQNGVIVWIDRDLQLLASDGRPLSKDKETIKKLYEERKEAYAFFADKKIKNDGEIDKVAKGVKEFYENFSD